MGESEREPRRTHASTRVAHRRRAVVSGVKAGAAFLIGAGMAFLANPEPNLRTLIVAIANGAIAMGAYLLDPPGVSRRLVAKTGVGRVATKTKDGVN
jgi:hypothetical protein